MCARPWNLYRRRRRFVADLHLENGVKLLCCSPTACAAVMVTSLIRTRLDYGSATLSGVPGHLLNRFQSVLNAAGRLVCHVWKYDHVTHLLRDLRWLWVPERIH